MALGTYSLRIAWGGSPAFDGTYDDVTDDVVNGKDLAYSYGLRRPYDRAAAAGRMTFYLNNGFTNQHSEAYIYSLDNTSSSIGGNLDLYKRVRLQCTYNDTTYTLWSGFVTAIEPQAGTWLVKVSCKDSIEPYTNTPVRGVVPRTDVTTDVMIADIVAATTIPNYSDGIITFDQTLFDSSDLFGEGGGYSADLDTGTVTLAYAGDDWNPERTSALQAIEDITTAEWGRFWVQPDGTITFRNAAHIYNNAAPDVTLNASGYTRLKTRTRADDVYNRIEVTTTPRNLVTSTTVITAIDQPIDIGGGESVVERINYGDQGSGERIAALSIVPPVAGTDYSTTGSISLSATNYGSYADVSITNNGVAATEVNGLQIRSNEVVYTYDRYVSVAEDTDAQRSAYGTRAYRLNLGTGASVQRARAIADLLLLLYQSPRTLVEDITINNSTTSGYSNLLNRGILDTVRLTDTETGLSAKDYLIISVDGRIRRGHHEVSWGLEPRISGQWITFNSTLFDSADKFVPL